MHMKITIYTISDCYFSKQEKEYLQSHNLPFEERNLEENREYLTEMLTISNNFAGTPVTKIEKDDGQIVVLKGFTKDEFDKTFHFVTTPAMEDAMSQITDAPTPPTPVTTNPVVPPAPAYVPESNPTTPVGTPPKVDLGSIAAQIEQLKKLQESLAAQAQKPAPVVPPSAPAIPSYQAPAVQQVAVAPPAPPVVVAAPVQTPTPPPAAPTTAPANVDDSLAAILAELQTKINSSQPSGTPSAPPTTN